MPGPPQQRTDGETDGDPDPGDDADEGDAQQRGDGEHEVGPVDPEQPSEAPRSIGRVTATMTIAARVASGSGASSPVANSRTRPMPRRPPPRSAGSWPRPPRRPASATSCSRPGSPGRSRRHVRRAEGEQLLVLVDPLAQAPAMRDRTLVSAKATRAIASAGPRGCWSSPSTADRAAGRPGRHLADGRDLVLEVEARRRGDLRPTATRAPGPAASARIPSRPTNVPRPMAAVTTVSPAR